jgi:hypothetical protein
VFDLHVHAGPCVMPRLADDVRTADWYEAAGATGFVLKGHCEPTVGRAAAAGAGRDVAVYGGIVLNNPVGGLNPAAVAAALSMGARVVWLPTVDARAHRESGLGHPSSCAPALEPSPSHALPPVDPSSEPTVRTILRLVAEADAVLATGHVSAAEAAWVVREARREGVTRLLLTHPGFTVPGMSAADARELADLGATVEVTAYQFLHQPGCDAARLAAFIREVGEMRCVLSSDAGQPASPPAPEALQQLIDVLVGQGLDRATVTAMSSRIPQQLVV